MRPAVRSAPTVATVEWLALGIWIIVVAVALPLGSGALSGAPTLGLQAIAAVAGLVLCILFIADEQRDTAAWVAFALALVGAAAVTAGAARLLSGEHQSTPAGQRAQELQASLAGAALPLYATAAFVGILMALRIGTESG
jgi:hypothetical protein